MVFTGVSIQIEGLDEIISQLNNITSGAGDQAVINSLNNIADYMTNEMRNNAHVITGRMKGSIARGTPSGNTVDVVATAPYAAFENARIGGGGGKFNPPPHDFADRALLATQQIAPDIIKQEFDRILKVF